MPTQGPLLDNAQILPRIYDSGTNTIGVTVPGGATLPVEVVNSLIPEAYDALALTYYSSGSGAGQVQTVQYYQGGLTGTLVATLTLGYNGSGQVSSVVRT